MRARRVALLTTALVAALGMLAEARAAPRGNPLWAVPLGALTETGERPIFSASRRPPAPAVAIAAAPPAPAEAPKPQAPERPTLQLVGTISGGALHLGLFLDEATQQPTRLAVGESRDGWTLRAVSATDARFESAERTATLALRVATEARSEGDARPADVPIPVTPSRRRRR